tara:strand:+ start:399 stop:1412 length:1014 start_codon:yes stop_codon:yes gene_type:complete
MANIPPNNSVKISPKEPKPISPTSGNGSTVTFTSGDKKTPKISYTKIPFAEKESKADLLANNILNKKNTSTPIIKDSSLDDNIVNVQMNKSVYGNFAINNNLDSEFTELGKTDLNRDVSTFFNLYEELFYDIPTKGGIESHENLVLRSRDYLRGFTDPKDIEIEGLITQIEELNDKILQLESRPPLNINQDLQDNLEGLADNITSTVTDIQDDLEEDLAEPEIIDENEDGIDDTTQSFSNHGTPKRLILQTSNNNANKALQNPGCVYYKDKYYGRDIYIFSRKVKKVRNRVVIYDGARGKKGRRFIIDIDDGKSYKIKKRHWKSKNYNKLDIFGLDN